MCGIYASSGPVSKFEALSNFEALRHRGPDATAAYQEAGGPFLGTHRLSIIDLSSPVVTQVGDIGVAFNGEIYNYIEIRQELRSKYHFDGGTDTEVLVNAYREWGLGMFPYLNGMYAFVLYDKPRQRLVAARDIAGEKPLYYRLRGGHITFASEAKSLGWDCIELPPAHRLIYDLRSRAVDIEPHWRFIPREIDPRTAEEELDSLLAYSVKLRTRSDVPYGLYFSGGVDSTLISSYHDFEHRFTYDDGDYADEFLRELPRMAWHLDYPIESFSAFGLWKLAQQAKAAGVKVVLSGEGADELFGGYVRYLPGMQDWLARKRYPSYPSYFPNPVSVSESGWGEFHGNMRELLRMGDRMAAAWGIENRCPFLDPSIITFAYSLAPELKSDGLELKIILRNILRRRVPEWVDFEKVGLYCSVNEWLGVANRFDKAAYVKAQAQALGAIPAMYPRR